MISYKECNESELMEYPSLQPKGLYKIILIVFSKDNSNKMDKIIHKSGQMKKEIDMLIPFVKEPWRDFTLSEIKEITKNKSHHYVYEALEKFSRSEVLNKEMRGNTNIYKLNGNLSDFSSLELAEIRIKEKNSQVPICLIKAITDKIKESFFTFIITGSYAGNKQTKSSDIDVAIIIPNASEKKQYEIALKEGELLIPEVHGFIFTED
jgi:hypothetical protein